MTKSNFSSEEFSKHRKGPKRSLRLNEWYENSTGHREAKQFFSATPNGVPNNPTNFQSYTPTSSRFSPEGQPDGDVVFRRNPYGDAEQVVQQEGPMATRPTQMGNYFNRPMHDSKLDRPNFVQTPGPASGMSTSFGGFGKGPSRNERRERRERIKGKKMADFADRMEAGGFVGREHMDNRGAGPREHIDNRGGGPKNPRSVGGPKNPRSFADIYDHLFAAPNIK